MLHEILLSLSGIPSSVLEAIDLNEKPVDSQHALDPYASQPERDMLKVLTHLADLHSKVREKSNIISASHPVPTCRAVSASIKNTHLQAFTKKVLDIESSILQNDAAYVGAYRSVPLSTLVTEFQPWLKPLRWLWETLQLLKADYSISELFLYLRKECQTGYSDLRDIATALLVTAQQAWINSLMPWLLFGELPHTGKQSFMIQISGIGSDEDFSVDQHQVPYFVSDETLDSILSIGKALNQIRSRKWLRTGVGVQSGMLPSLLSFSLDKVKSLPYPIKAHDLDNAIEDINIKLSETTLTQFLPADMISTLLFITRQFLLLQDGDFAFALVKQIGRLLQSQSSTTSAKSVRKLGRLEGFKISEPELSAILENTWAELSTPASESATAWIHFTSDVQPAPINFLLPTPAGLTLRLPASSPLHIFMTKSDTRKYADISAYLISVQRAKVQAVDLWSRPELRRRTQMSLTRTTSNTSKVSRDREEQRARLVRPHWICANQIVLLLSELISYLHGEVVGNSWLEFQHWLEGHGGSRPSSSKNPSRPTTAPSRVLTAGSIERGSNLPKASTRSSTRRNDPRILARAHRLYLDTLYRALLLDNKIYVSVLRDLLSLINHFVALFYRLQVVWEGLDFQLDQAVTNAFSDYIKEERELLDELIRTNAHLVDSIHDLVNSIREAEKERDVTDLRSGISAASLYTDRVDFKPWIARSLDRLLMKLDSLAGNEKEEDFQDAIVGDEG